MIKLAKQAIACPHTLRHAGYEYLARIGDAGSFTGFVENAASWDWWILDLSVLDKLISHLQRRDANINEMVSINLSADTMCHGGAWRVWIAGLGRLIDLHEQVLVEISEIDMCDGDGRLGERIDDIHATGALVALDDVDGDVRSHRRMMDHHFDVVKIDWRLPKRQGKDGVTVKLLEDIVHFCLRSGKKCVLEGVELPADLQIAQDIGVHYVQGFGIHRPMRL